MCGDARRLGARISVWRRRTIQPSPASDQSATSRSSILAKWRLLQVASRAGRLRAIDAMAKSMSLIGVPRCCSVAFHRPKARDAGSLQSAQRNAARKRRNSPARRRRRREFASRRDKPKNISAATGVQRKTEDGSSVRSWRNAFGRRCMTAETALVSRSNIRMGDAPDCCGRLRWRPESRLRRSEGVAGLLRSSDRSRKGLQARTPSLQRPADTNPRSAGSCLFLAPSRAGSALRARIAESVRSCSAWQILVEHVIPCASGNRSRGPNRFGSGVVWHRRDRIERSRNGARPLTLHRSWWPGRERSGWASEQYARALTDWIGRGSASSRVAGSST